MKVIPCLVILGILAASVLLAGCTTPATKPETAEMNAVAEEISTSINNGLGDIKEGLRNTSRTLSATGLSGPAAGAAMSENLRYYPWTLTSFTLSPEGIVLAAVPEDNAGFVSMNLSGQSHVQKANADRAPTVSGVFPMVEGITAMLQTYPVFSASGEYLGYVDITYAPEVFLAERVRPVTNGTSYDVWVIQRDGTEIYDTTPEEIGKNILTDPVYADPALREFANRVVQEPSGTGRYTFWNREWNRNVTKLAVWDTAGIDGAEWRVVVTREDGSSR